MALRSFVASNPCSRLRPQNLRNGINASRNLRTHQNINGIGSWNNTSYDYHPCVVTSHRNFATDDKGSDKSKESNLPSVPTLQDAKSMDFTMKSMNNDFLMILAGMDNEPAVEEVLKRHIMCVDEVDYDEADETFHKIRAENRRGMVKYTLPYFAGISTAVVLAFGSIPLCFDYNAVHWFNEQYVTMDVPEPRDLETWLEVGSWSWNWMEPPLGQISFLLLCLGYARSQLQNLGIRPYTGLILQRRANRLVETFPQYSPELVRKYSECDKKLFIFS